MKDKPYVKYDIDNRLSLQLPIEKINIDWAEFEVLKTKVDKRSKKVYIELKYKELKE